MRAGFTQYLKDHSSTIRYHTYHPIGLEAIRVPPKAAILALRDYRPHSEQTERR